VLPFDFVAPQHSSANWINEQQAEGILNGNDELGRFPNDSDPVWPAIVNQIDDPGDGTRPDIYDGMEIVLPPSPLSVIQRSPLSVT
jgi:hypothetical protein